MNLLLIILENCFEEAKLLGVPYVAEKIEMAGFPQPEIIINEEKTLNQNLRITKRLMMRI